METKLRYNDIMYAVSESTGVPIEQISSKCRTKQLCTARFIAYYFLYFQGGMTLVEIGKKLHRTHASVLHGIREAIYWENHHDKGDKETRDNGTMIKTIKLQLCHNNFC